MEQREVDNMLLSMIQKHFPSLPLSDEHTDWGKWLGFARAVYEAGRASPASVLGGWKHSCNALCMGDVELWIPQCPHCGKPAPTPPVSEDRWLPIATAPNYEEVMVWPYPTEYCMTAKQGQIPGKRDSFGWWYSEYETGFGFVPYECKPTHWMPLPKAPAMQEDKP